MTSKQQTLVTLSPFIGTKSLSMSETWTKCSSPTSSRRNPCPLDLQKYVTVPFWISLWCQKNIFLDLFKSISLKFNSIHLYSLRNGGSSRSSWYQSVLEKKTWIFKTRSKIWVWTWNASRPASEAVNYITEILLFFQSIPCLKEVVNVGWWTKGCYWDRGYEHSRGCHW